MIKTIEKSAKRLYASPKCVELEILAQGTVLTGSSLMEKNWNSTPEGYDIDKDAFNW
jgi:hypothetical protein